jgi:peroxiredoxin
LIAFVLAVVAAGGVLLGWSMGTQPPAEIPPAAVVGPTSPSASTATAPAPITTAAPRQGRVLTLDDAFRELDLIRPSREKIAEDFTLGLADGRTFRLADHRGQVVLINFWATWCPPCREEMPSLERLHRQHKAQGLVLVAVSLDADAALVPPYVKTSKLTFPIALDPKAEVGNKYGVRALPSSFVVDRKGTLTALALGPRTWDNDAAHSLVEALVVDGPRRSPAASRTP